MRGFRVMPAAAWGLRLAGLLAALAAPAVALADSAPDSQIAQSAVKFDIPAQSLSAALTQFGRQAGLQISFDPPW